MLLANILNAANTVFSKSMRRRLNTTAENSYCYCSVLLEQWHDAYNISKSVESFCWLNLGENGRNVFSLAATQERHNPRGFESGEVILQTFDQIDTLVVGARERLQNTKWYVNAVTSEPWLATGVARNSMFWALWCTSIRHHENAAATLNCDETWVIPLGAVLNSTMYTMKEHCSEVDQGKATAAVNKQKVLKLSLFCKAKNSTLVNE